METTALTTVNLTPDTLLMIRERLAEGIARSIVNAAISEMNQNRT